MITLRKGNERGSVKLPWLYARHTFSFGSYFDPNWMGFGPLRVINQDIIDEGKGFDTHPHQDMEIITYILEGEIEHKDTLGNKGIIRPGQIQVMSAGTGIQHSEFNPQQDQKTHLLQIWIEPNKLGIKPRYEQYDVALKENELTLILSPEGGENIAKVYQDAKLYHGHIKSLKHEINSKKDYWLQVTKGSGFINKLSIEEGDGLAITDESQLEFISLDGMNILLFEV